jgi:hypothetical protein
MDGLVVRAHPRSSRSAMLDLWIKLCSMQRQKCCVGSVTASVLILSRPATSLGRQFPTTSETSSTLRTRWSARSPRRGSASRNQASVGSAERPALLIDGVENHQSCLALCRTAGLAFAFERRVVHPPCLPRPTVQARTVAAHATFSAPAASRPASTISRCRSGRSAASSSRPAISASMRHKRRTSIDP